jgi:hypothetical protein
MYWGISMESIGCEKYSLLKYELYYDMVERVRILENNILHIYQLSKFLSNYYDTYYGSTKNSKDPKNIYECYIPILELIIDDLNIFKNVMRNLKHQITVDLIHRHVLNDSSEQDSRIHYDDVKVQFVKDILFQGFSRKSDGERQRYSEIYKSYVSLILSKYKYSTVDDVLLCMRKLIEWEDNESIRITLGQISKTFGHLNHSLSQSMGGLFVGNTLENEPSAYSHKDLYHIMEYMGDFCKSYQDSIKSLIECSVSKLYDDELKEEFREIYYNVSGIDLNLGEKSDNTSKSDNISYTIVFGDCTLPCVIDRYKLISLPITCAYRPRYWSALSHEVSHSFINGIIYLEEIIYQTEKINNKSKNMLKKLKKPKIQPNEINIFNNICNTIELCAKLKYIGNLEKIFTPHSSNPIILKTQISEIVADVFGFLLSGFAYLPALVSNITLGRVTAYSGTIPYLLRIGVVVGLANKFCKSDLSIYKDENDGKIGELLSSKPISSEILTDFRRLIRDERDKIANFIDCFENIFNDDFISDNNYGYEYFVYALGKDLGERIYDQELKNIIDYISSSDSIKCFGWFKIDSEDKSKSDDAPYYDPYYVLLNQLLNVKCIERINELVNPQECNINKIVSTMCYNNESTELIETIRNLKWEWCYGKR